MLAVGSMYHVGSLSLSDNTCDTI